MESDWENPIGGKKFQFTPSVDLVENGQNILE